MRKILKFILKILAKRVIARYQPIVIGITGSVGKTTAKEAIYAVLSRKFWVRPVTHGVAQSSGKKTPDYFESFSPGRVLDSRLVSNGVRKNEENYNNELGVPMAVLGVDAKKFQVSRLRQGFGGQAGFRFQAISHKLSAISRAMWLAYGWPKQQYPKFLILELAADRPGDIDYLVDIVQPQVGVVTAVGEMPAHVEFYASPEDVAREKGKLIERLPVPGGLAVLNYDDWTMLDMKERSKAKITTFGLVAPSDRSGPDVWASDISYFMADVQLSTIGGLSFKINYSGTFVPARINNLIGTHQLYGILAGVAVGLHFGMNLVDISGAFENIELPHGRMNLIKGIKNSIVIDDTYNASPLSMHAALDTLHDLAKVNRELGRNGRRIAVLGNMRELGKYEIEAHQAIGNFAAERCDILITVGAAGKIIADSAANQMFKENVMSFNTSDEVKSKVQEIIQEGDIVLVKGSRAMEMEKVVDEIRPGS